MGGPETGPHGRRSIRLRGYDYTEEGAYFITVCTHERQHLLGRLEGQTVVLSRAGQLVSEVWSELPQHYPGIEVDAFVVMPNHVHGVILLVGAGPRACPQNGRPQGVAPTGGAGRSPDNARRLSLGEVIHRLKSLTATRWRLAGTQHPGGRAPKRLWQRNYYERVIRDQRELEEIQDYIANNPLQWFLDRENPERVAEAEIYEWLYPEKKAQHGPAPSGSGPNTGWGALQRNDSHEDNQSGGQR